MDARAIAALALLFAATACGARTTLRTEDGGAGSQGGAGSEGGAPPCSPFLIETKATVPSIVAEGERIYYVVTEGRVMSADADTGATTLLAQIPPQPINIPVALAVDAESIYASFDVDGAGAYGLFRLPKTGGAPEKIDSGRIDNAFVDATGLYWTKFLAAQAKHEVFRRLPGGVTVVALGLVDESYNPLRGVFRGTAGLLVPSETALFAFDLQGAGPITLSDVWHISSPFERDGGLFFNVDFGTPHGFFRSSPDGTMPEQLYEGPFDRVVTDGVRWVFTSPNEEGHAVFGASYPDGERSLVYQSPISVSPRAVALTPTRLVLGAAFWEGQAGIQSLCRGALGL